jgi:gliding motility-associated-like protein
MSAGPVASREWNFQGGTPSTSTALNPTNICYNSPGNYEAMLIVSDGVNTDTIRKQIMVLTPPIVNAGSDETIIPGDSVTLHATGNLLNYIWSPSAGLSDVTIANPIAFPVTTTTYYVTGTDGNNCSALDSITINIEIPCGEIFVPTAFSQNNDLQNDMECVLGDCIVSMKFTIYDRWGEKVFETTDQKICWDGNYKGQVMNTATFVYSLSATLINGKEIIKKGNISLIR